jgi:hypothetical protein
MKTPKSHPREWVDGFRSDLHASTRPLPWVGFKNLPGISCRQDLNHPPTPVGGISEFQRRSTASGSVKNCITFHPPRRCDLLSLDR